MIHVAIEVVRQGNGLWKLLFGPKRPPSHTADTAFPRGSQVNKILLNKLLKNTQIIPFMSIDPLPGGTVTARAVMNYLRQAPPPPLISLSCPIWEGRACPWHLPEHLTGLQNVPVDTAREVKALGL